jgi:hypothetical protein
VVKLRFCERILSLVMPAVKRQTEFFHFKAILIRNSIPKKIDTELIEIDNCWSGKCTKMPLRSTRLHEAVEIHSRSTGTTAQELLLHFSVRALDNLNK